MSGFSPEFLRVVVRELELVQRRVDRLDAQIEAAKRKDRKDKLSAQRALQVNYANWLRKNLLR